jgi:hypothetical protein
MEMECRRAGHEVRLEGKEQWTALYSILCDPDRRGLLHCDQPCFIAVIKAAQYACDP